MPAVPTRISNVVAARLMMPPLNMHPSHSRGIVTERSCSEMLTTATSKTTETLRRYIYFPSQ
jgi:hypothetical protein